MFAQSSKAVGAWLILCVVPVCCPNAGMARAGILSIETIKNNHTAPVSDLHLKFTNTVRNVKLVYDNDGDGNVDEYDPTSSGNDSASWDTTVFGFVGQGGKVQIKYDAQARPLGKIDINSGDTFWTVNDVRFPNTVGLVAQPPGLSFVVDPSTQQVLAFATFVNPETFDVVYSNIQLYRDNNIGNFNISLFDMPTGSLVSGLPTSVTLRPGESLVLPFGVVSQGQRILT